MTRRLVFAVLLVAAVLFFCWVTGRVLENAASAQPTKQKEAARTTPSAASRNLNRPVWLASTVPHSTQGATLAAHQTAVPFQPAATLSRPAPATPQTPDVATFGASPVTPGAGPDRTREESSTAPRQDPAAQAKAFARTLVDPSQWSCLDKLWWRESRWLATADNPNSTAFGVAQLLGEESTDSRTQVRDGLAYIAHRYHGSACEAWAFWRNHGWY